MIDTKTLELLKRQGDAGLLRIGMKLDMREKTTRPVFNALEAEKNYHLEAPQPRTLWENIKHWVQSRRG